jgi:hypothetical protein
MICSECKKVGKKSKVYSGASSSTLMHCQPFYDEDGKYHNHDMNITTTNYSCSNGHSWQEHYRSSCWCGWKGQQVNPPDRPLN